MRKIFIIFFIATPLLLLTNSMQQLFGEEYKYDSKGRRDPFIPLVTGNIRTSLGLQSVETAEDINLEGIIFDPNGKSIAVLNGEIVKEGDKLYNIEIVKIYSSSIVLKIYDKPHKINLIKEGGETVED